MARELICGRCGRSSIVEVVDPLAICPDCGASLLEPAGDAPTVDWQPLTDEIPAYGDAAADGTSEVLTSALGALAAVPDGDTAILADEVADFEAAHRTTVYDVPIKPADAAPRSSSESPTEAYPEPPLDGLESRGPDTIAMTPAAFSADTRLQSPSTSHSPLSIMGRAVAAISAASAAARVPAAGPSPLLFRIVISYASVVTIACAYLAYLLFQRAPSLDLPDIPPPPQSGNRVTTLHYLPPEKLLPPLQRLRLGESRRFGSVKITPLRVTRGSLEFAGDDPTLEEGRPDSTPVLKLHLRIENASPDQQFVPLDRRLVFTKEPDPKHLGLFKANNFLCRTGERNRRDRHVLAFDLAPEGPWMIRGENLDRELEPGESVETFIPTTEEGWDALSGPLVWRIHLRKGYNRQSLRGVTTLVEVTFDSAEIDLDRSTIGGKA